MCTADDPGSCYCTANPELDTHVTTSTCDGEYCCLFGDSECDCRTWICAAPNGLGDCACGSFKSDLDEFYGGDAVLADACDAPPGGVCCAGAGCKCLSTTECPEGQRQVPDCGTTYDWIGDGECGDEAERVDSCTGKIGAEAQG